MTARRGAAAAFGVAVAITCIALAATLAGRAHTLAAMPRLVAASTTDARPSAISPMTSSDLPPRPASRSSSPRSHRAATPARTGGDRRCRGELETELAVVMDAHGFIVTDRDIAEWLARAFTEHPDAAADPASRQPTTVSCFARS